MPNLSLVREDGFWVFIAREELGKLRILHYTDLSIELVRWHT